MDVGTDEAGSGPFVMSHGANVKAQKEEKGSLLSSPFASSPLSDSLQIVQETREFLHNVGLLP